MIPDSTFCVGGANWKCWGVTISIFHRKLRVWLGNGFLKNKAGKWGFKSMLNEKMQESMSFGAQFLRYWYWSKMPFYATYLLNCSRKVCPGNRIIVPTGDCFTLHTNLKISLKILKFIVSHWKHKVMKGYGNSLNFVGLSEYKPLCVL